jgi:hypothetical protein
LAPQNASTLRRSQHNFIALITAVARAAAAPLHYEL